MEGFNLGSIVAHIKADASQFSAGLEEAKAQADGFSTGLSKLAMGTAAVVDALVIGFGVKSVKAFADAQQVSAQLNQVLESTGKKASITESSVHDLAMKLEEYSGKTHDAIEAGQTILLQYDGITNKTLPDASKAMVDLSQRMGIDTVSAAKLMGLALTDPEAGIGRLRRAGVVLTDDQKEMIKSMQKSGDTAGAAAVLMGALESKVGGAGGAYRKTLAGGVAEAKAKLQDFEILLGGKIINTLNEAYTWYTKHARVLNDIAGVVGTLVGVLAVALILYGNWILLTKGLALAQAALNLVMDMNPIVLAIMAVVVVAALLLEHWKTVKQWFTDLWDWFKKNWENVLMFIAPFMIIPIEIIKHWQQILDWFKNMAHMIKESIGQVNNLLYDVGKDIINGLINGVKDMAEHAKDAVKNVASGIKDVAKKILGVFSPSTVFHEIGMNVGQGLVNGLSSMTDAVGSASANMAAMAVAPATSMVNTMATNNSNISTSINGPINIGSQSDADYFLKRLTQNQELAVKGLTPVH